MQIRSRIAGLVWEFGFLCVLIYHTVFGLLYMYTPKRPSLKTKPLTISTLANKTLNMTRISWIGFPVMSG